MMARAVSACEAPVPNSERGARQRYLSRKAAKGICDIKQCWKGTYLEGKSLGADLDDVKHACVLQLLQHHLGLPQVWLLLAVCFDAADIPTNLNANTTTNTMGWWRTMSHAMRRAAP